MFQEIWTFVVLTDFNVTQKRLKTKANVKIIKTIFAIKTFINFTTKIFQFSRLLPQHFDVFGKTELMFFLTRILLNVRM